ncbi:MAG: bifunctional glutamate N-acetyltransferase/amino-acid acetyltransferase ArgJ [Nitrospirae bacterium]|nr:bifunctional glutamate N-acetyltransferase/amino-acid acetyltransferase ArgJ [Nitrospirota bacterium]
MIPKGFIFSTVEAAVKKPGRQDIALIVSAVEADMAGTFTTNTVKAAPVKICMKKIASCTGQAIVVNSGNANACTGQQGMKDAREMIRIVSKETGLGQDLVYIASTGVIGTPLPMERIRQPLKTLAKEIGKATLDEVAKAIMTTDTFPKVVHRRLKIGNVSGTVSGICKGAGMIAPNMATMLCFILTDFAVGKKTLSAVLKSSVKRSFNRITIDGDMSTNDTVLMMANGLAGNDPVTAKSQDLVKFQKAVDEITYELAELVVKDGEGATKLVEVLVKGARTEKDAEKAAFSVANSCLVKTAVHGNDANWGRIICAVGYSGISFKEERADIYFNKVKVVKDGLANNKDKEATEELKAKKIRITVDLKSGKAGAKVLTCDLSEAYVRINAEYRT